MTAFASGKEEAADDLVSLIVGLLGEKDKDLRAVGLDQIRTEAKGEAATRQFAAQLPKLSADAQAGLLSALADRGDAAARPAVVELLRATHDEPVKVAAIGALGALGDVRDLPSSAFLFVVGLEGREVCRSGRLGAFTRRKRCFGDGRDDSKNRAMFRCAWR